MADGIRRYFGGRARVLSVNFRSFRLVNFFDVHFSWQFSYFSAICDGLERV